LNNSRNFNTQDQLQQEELIQKKKKKKKLEKWRCMKPSS
jgi:hypothetical protein